MLFVFSRDRSKSPRRPNPHSDGEYLAGPITDELTEVGLPEDHELSMLFEKTGQCRGGFGLEKIY